MSNPPFYRIELYIFQQRRKGNTLCEKLFPDVAVNQIPALKRLFTPIYWITIWFLIHRQSSYCPFDDNLFLLVFVNGTGRTPVQYVESFYWRPCSHSSPVHWNILLKFRMQIISTIDTEHSSYTMKSQCSEFKIKLITKRHPGIGVNRNIVLTNSESIHKLDLLISCYK